MSNPKSKPALSDAERAITNLVIQRYLQKDEATSHRFLLRELKEFRSSFDDALRSLSDRSILNVVNNTYLEETYTPRAVAFHYCGDADALAFAKKSTEIMLRVVRNLFDRELETDGKDQKLFTREDAESEVRPIDPTVTLDMVRVGLALAEEFGAFRALQRNAQNVGVTSFLPGQRVFQLGENPWDEHIRRSSVSVGRAWEQNQSESSEIALPPLSAAGLEAYAAQPDNRKIFLVHGHAEEMQQSVATFLRSVGLELVILHEQVNQGRTIIEKLEKHSDVGFAVVLLTPDDVGASALQQGKTHPRARQNVILELGYFMGKLGRDKVCCLHAGGIELPSDYLGVLYVPYDRKGNWRWKLVEELSAAGIEVDSEKLSTVKEIDGVRDVFRAFFGAKK